MIQIFNHEKKKKKAGRPTKKIIHGESMDNIREQRKHRSNRSIEFTSAASQSRTVVSNEEVAN